MFKELDHNERRTGARELGRFFQRVLDVLFYDAQLMASVVHSNKMLQVLTCPQYVHNLLLQYVQGLLHLKC